MFVAVFALYAVLCALGPTRLERLLSLERAREFLVAALSSVDRDIRPDRTPPRATRHDIYSLVPSLAAVVLGSVEMVRTSIGISTRLGISQVVLGTLVLAALTGIPNVVAAARLAVRGRGSAVVSEALNSNTLNLLFGLVVPALIAGVGPTTTSAETSVGWLLALTILTLAFTRSRGGLSRVEGAVVIALYGVFVITVAVG